MDIEVKSSTDVGVAKEDADGLVVAVALNAPGGKTMAEAMKSHLREFQIIQKLLKEDPICPWLDRRCPIRQYIKIASDYLLEWFYQRQQVFRHGNVPDGILRLRSILDELSGFCLSLNQINPLQSSAHPDYPSLNVNVIPPQRTDLTDAEPCIETDVDAKVHEGKVLTDVSHEFSLAEKGQYFDILLFPFGRKMDVNLPELQITVLDTETEDHLEDDEDVPDGLLGEAGFQFAVNEGLHKFLSDIRFLSQLRKEMILDEECVRCVCRFLDILLFVGLPKPGNLAECCVLFHKKLIKNVKMQSSGFERIASLMSQLREN